MTPRLAASLALVLLALLGAGLLAPGVHAADAAIVVQKGVNRREAQVGDVLRYTIYFNNTGGNVARRVWINDTLPPGTRYLNDSAAAEGGIRTGDFNWTFTDVPVGPHRFYVNVSVTNEAVPGSYLVNLAALNYTNSVGVKQTPSTATASTLFGIKVKTLHFRDDRGLDPNNPLDPAITLAPTDNLNCNIASQCDWDNDGNRGITLRNELLNFSRPQSYHEWVQYPPMGAGFHLQGQGLIELWVDNPGASGSRTLNLFLLDWNGTAATLITTLAPTRILDGNPGFERWLVGIPPLDYYVAPGHYLVVILNVPPANPNPLYFAYDSRYSGPGCSAVCFDASWSMETGTYVYVAGVDTLEVGGNTSVRLFTHGETAVIVAAVVDPFGGFDIAGAWVNITDPLGAPVRTYEPMVLLWDFSPWRAYYYDFSPGPWPPQGTYHYEVTAQESNGVVHSRNGTFDIRYPVMAFAKVVDRLSVPLGQPFNYTLHFNNSGTGEARLLWVNDTLPPATDYLGDNAAAVGGTPVSPLHWLFLNVTPGTHSFNVTVRLRADAQPPNTFVNSAYFNYTDTKYNWEPPVVVQRSATATGPYLGLQVLVSNSLPREGEVWRLPTYFNNTGNEAAAVAWLNYTLSPNLIYKGDTAALTGLPFTRLLLGNTLVLRFDGVPPGAHGLQVNVTFAPGTAGGAGGRVDVGLEYRTGNGVQPPRRSASVEAHLHEPNVTLAFTLSRSSGNPGDKVRITLAYANGPAEASAARGVSLNVTLPAGLTFLVASPGGTYSAATRVVTWTLANLPAPGEGSVWVNASIAPGTPDGLQLGLMGVATFRDDANAPRPPVYAFANVTATAPRFTLAATVDRAAAEYQDTVAYRVYFNQTGAGTALYAYVNGTLGPGLTLVAVTGPGAVLLDIANGTFQVRATNVAAGGYSALVTARIATPFGPGRSLGPTFTLEAADANGNPLTPLLLAAPPVILRAPLLTVALQVDRASAAPGDPVRFTVTVRNDGTATARSLWVNLTLSPYIVYVGDSASVAPRQSGAELSWRFADLGPGGQITFSIDVEVNASAPADRTVAELLLVDYTEGRGIAVNETRSEVRTFRTLPARGLLEGPLPYLLPLGAAAGVAAFLALRRRQRVDIEEVFVVYKDGTLLAHRSKTLTPDKDEDVLTAMFTAVQEFISDSFQYGESKEVKGLHIGDYSVEIERGQYIYVAVVFKGSATPALRARLAALVKQVEAEYHDALAAWSGNMDMVRGLKDRVKVLLRGAR